MLVLRWITPAHFIPPWFLSNYSFPLATDDGLRVRRSVILFAIGVMMGAWHNIPVTAIRRRFLAPASMLCDTVAGDMPRRSKRGKLVKGGGPSVSGSAVVLCHTRERKRVEGNSFWGFWTTTTNAGTIKIGRVVQRRDIRSGCSSVLSFQFSPSRTPTSTTLRQRVK